MTPYDVYRKLISDASYISPENTEVALAKVLRAIRIVEAVFSSGPNTEAGAEAVEVLRKMRKFEKELRLQS